PDFVVIMITPSFARNPYNAAAAAPFKTVIEAISSGLILCKPPPSSDLACPVSVVLLMGIPLTTMRGELSPPNDDCPRIRILDEPPGPLAGGEMLTPASLP